MEFGFVEPVALWDSSTIADVIIVGGGPAGLTAAIYASRARLSTLLLEGGIFGGQAAITDKIENYPGFPDGVTGAELSALMEQQARKFGAVLSSDMAERIEERDGLFFVKGSTAGYKARSIIAATGAEYKKLGIEGEKEFLGRGVSFCATCDGAFFRDQRVAVIGGGDSAVKEALFLTRFASKVYIVHRRDRLRAEKVIQEEAFANKKVEMVWDTVPTQVMGETGVTGLRVKNVKTGGESVLSLEGVFVFIGTVPKTDYLNGLVEIDDSGYVVTDETMMTSRRGVFAAGDLRRKTLRQVATAVGDGAIAANSVEDYLEALGK